MDNSPPKRMRNNNLQTLVTVAHEMSSRVLADARVVVDPTPQQPFVAAHALPPTPERTSARCRIATPDPQPPPPTSGARRTKPPMSPPEKVLAPRRAKHMNKRLFSTNYRKAGTAEAKRLRQTMDLVQSGMALSKACSHTGMSRRTVDRYMHRPELQQFVVPPVQVGVASQKDVIPPLLRGPPESDKSSPTFVDLLDLQRMCKSPFYVDAKVCKDEARQLTDPSVVVRFQRRSGDAQAMRFTSEQWEAVKFVSAAVATATATSTAKKLGLRTKNVKFHTSAFATHGKRRLAVSH